MKVVVYYGPMGAGKTERLITAIKNDKSKKIIVKSAIDNRAGKKYISTHNYLNDPITYADEKIEATYAVETFHDLTLDDRFIEDIMDGVKSIYIDEGQFFPDLKEFVDCMMEMANIYISTLDKDWKKKYFPSFEKLLEIGEIEKIRLCAKCDVCEERNAIYSYKRDQEQKTMINGFLVGGSSIYGSICDNCDKR